MSHEQAKKQLAAGTPPELVCAACPWDRLCIEPPSMTGAEVDKAIADAEARDKTRDPAQSGMPVGMLLTALTLGGRDSNGRLCPVFVLRLRSPDGRVVADAVRTLMRTYDETQRPGTEA